MSGIGGRPEQPLDTMGKMTFTPAGEDVVNGRVRYRDSRGSYHVYTAKGADYNDVASKLNAKVDAFRNRRGAGSKKLTPSSRVRELAESYLATLPEQGLAIQTVSRYRMSVLHTVIPAIGNLRLNEVDGAVIAELLLETNRQHSSEARSTRSVLRAMFEQALLARAVDANWGAVRVRMKRSARKSRAIAASSVPDFFTLIAGDSDRERMGPKTRKAHRDLEDILTVQLGAGGMRLSEAAALTVEDLMLDDEDQETRIRSHRAIVYMPPSGASHIPPGKRKPVYEVAGGYIVQEVTKTKQNRVLTVDEHAEAVLRRRAAEVGSGLLFQTESGTPLNLNNVRRTLRSVIAGSEFQGWVSTHTMRRSVGTIIAEKYGAAVASAVLGHADEATTRQSYIEERDVAPDVSSDTGGLR